MSNNIKIRHIYREKYQPSWCWGSSL